LEGYKLDGDNFLNSIVPGNETWVAHNTIRLKPRNSPNSGVTPLHPQPESSKLKFQQKKS